MYEPLFNSVLVEIDDNEAKWGKGNDESMLGASYSKGKVIRIASFVSEHTHPFTDRAEGENVFEAVFSLTGRDIMWNEGAEAGTIFEFDGKQFGFIYWWDIRGVLVGEKAKDVSES